MRKIKNFLNIKNENYALLVFLSLFIIFATGIFSIFSRAPMSWLDEQIHYARVIQLSNGDLFKKLDNDYSKMGGDISKNHQFFIDRSMSKIVSSLSGKEESIISLDWQKNYNDLSYTSEKQFSIATGAVPYNPIVYASYILIAKLNKLFKLDISTEYILMKLSGFFLAFFIFAYSVKVIPFGKWTLCTLGLLPTVILSMSSITADSFSFSIIFLFISYSMKLAINLTEKDILRKEIILYLLISFLMINAKMPAFLLIGLYIPLLVIGIMNNTLTIKKRFILIISIILFAIYTIVWFSLIKDINTGSYHGREGIDTFKQISYIFSYPKEFLSVLLKVLNNYNFFTLQLGYADSSKFMNLGTLLSTLIAFSLGISIFIQDDIDIKETKVYKNYTIFPFLSIALYIGITIVIFILLYLQFNAVGSNDISGVQPRYFLPYLLLLFLFIPKIKTYNSKLSLLSFLPLLYYVLISIYQIIPENQKDITISVEKTIKNSNITQGGYIDEIKINDKFIYIKGWMLSGDKIIRLISKSDVEIENILIIQRKDVASALDDNNLINSGFELIIKSNDIPDICLISEDHKYGYRYLSNSTNEKIYKCVTQ